MLSQTYADYPSPTQADEVKKMTVFNEASSPRIICPECHGNGYIKLPHTAATEWKTILRWPEAGYDDKYILQQCEQCSSQGEIDGKV